jgi:hypothetical protein
MPKISAEVARVTSGHFIATVRSVGGTPTISVDSVEKARHFKHDNGRDRCEIEFCDGRQIVLSFHLFAALELRSYFLAHLDMEDLRGPKPRERAPPQPTAMSSYFVATRSAKLIRRGTKAMRKETAFLPRPTA